MALPVRWSFGVRRIRFPPDVIAVAVRWYLRYGLSYRDVEELLNERGIVVDHVTIYRWVQRFTPLFIDAARPCRHSPGDRWLMDETYVKIGGRWHYLYRANDQYGQVDDVYLSARRDAAAARAFFTKALAVTQCEPVEVVTDRPTPTCGWSRTSSRRRGITSSSTPTTRSSATTADSRPGCVRCAVSKVHDLGRWSWPDMRSCRTIAEATTNSSVSG